jgi:hypothetical protein
MMMAFSQRAGYSFGAATPQNMPWKPIVSQHQGSAEEQPTEPANLSPQAQDAYTPTQGVAEATQAEAPLGPEATIHPEEIFQNKNDPTQGDSPIYLHPAFEDDVFSNVKPEKVDPLQKKPRLRDNIEFQKKQEESNPLVNCTPVRLIGGYSNETFESVVEPVAAIMGAIGVNKTLANNKEFIESAKLVQEGIKNGVQFPKQEGLTKLIHGDPAFKIYAEKGMLGKNGVGMLDLFEKFSYGIVGTYCAADAGYHGYRGYKSTKEQTGDNGYALARGAQLAGGQGIFQYLASYMIPAKFIKDIIYVQTNNLMTTIPNMLAGSLKAKPEHEPPMSDLMTDGMAKSVVKTSEQVGGALGRFLAPVTTPIAKTFDSSFLLDQVEKSMVSGAEGALKNPKAAMAANVASSVVAGGVALASIPVCAKYLDPLFEKVVHELYYRPTNALLAAAFPNAYRNQLAQFEAEQPPEERSLTDAELEKRMPGVFNHAKRRDDKTTTPPSQQVVPKAS